MKKILSLVFFVFLFLNGFSQSEIQKNKLRSKQNTQSELKSTQGNNSIFKPEIKVEVVELVKESAILNHANLLGDLEQIKAKKKQIKANRSAFRTAKRNGTWKKLKDSEKRIKQKIKESKA